MCVCVCVVLIEIIVFKLIFFISSELRINTVIYYWIIIVIIVFWLFQDLCNTNTGSSSTPITINAHQSEITCLAINQRGTMVATVSIKGTLIRVWDTLKRHLLHELRRGSITSPCLNWLFIYTATR